ncbi:MAG: rod shape-determining protein RodA [Candidatus Latescibacteria bacterium]|nr:rod shape-determining protein RodA [Candidatus Latescibacterota bacterium]
MIKLLIDRNMDYGLILSVCVLMAVGVLMIHSASAGDNVDSANIWQKQLVWSIMAFVVMISVVFLPFKFLYSLSYIFYGVCLFLLIMTEIRGTMGGGSERWLNFGPMRFQPSEFMKIATILALARWLSSKNNRPTSYKKLLVPSLIVFLPMAFIAKQPDLGTSLVFFAIIFPMLYWAGLDTVRLFFLVAPILSAVFSAPFLPFSSWVWIVFMFVVLAILYYSRYTLQGMIFNIGANIFAGIATPYAFGKLKPYQQKRITTFINPEADPLDSGYQIINAKIALGSGGVFGKGLGEGRYTELGFLPRSHTDFIFSVIGEEFGFVGSIFVLGVIFFLVYRGIVIASVVKNPFMSIAAVGISTVFIFHMFVNVGMVAGIMPVTGLPLPFISYGGSSCMTSAALIGLLLNFSINRHEY